MHAKAHIRPLWGSMLIRRSAFPSSQRAPYTVALASLGGNLITFNDKYTDINAFFSHRRGFFEYKHQS